MYKKIISTTLLLAMLLSVWALSGCGKSKDTETYYIPTKFSQGKITYLLKCIGNDIEIYSSDTDTLITHFAFNGNGKLAKLTDYDSDGKASWRYEYEYDSKGNQTKEIRYDSDGKVSSRYECEYDRNGNETKGTHYGSDGKVSEHYECEYDRNGNVTKYINRHFENGELKSEEEQTLEWMQVTKEQYDAFQRFFDDAE